MKLLRRLAGAGMVLVAFGLIYLPWLFPGTYPLNVYLGFFWGIVAALVLVFFNRRGVSDWRRVRTRVGRGISKKNLLWGAFGAVLLAAALIPTLYPPVYPLAILAMLLLFPAFYLLFFYDGLPGGSNDRDRERRMRR